MTDQVFLGFHTVNNYKNTTGLHLMQGPVTVFEGSSYAGDARIMDLQPKEERLVSYAVDLGTEVEPVAKRAPDRLTAVKMGALMERGEAQQIIQGGTAQATDTITARKIVLGDGRKPGLILTADAMSVCDSEGREVTRVDGDGFLLLDGRRSVRASLTADRDGSYLYLRDAKGRDRCYIRAVNVGPGYWIVDENNVKWNVLLYDRRRPF